MMRCLFAERTHNELDKTVGKKADEGSNCAFSGMCRIDLVVHNGVVSLVCEL